MRLLLVATLHGPMLLRQQMVRKLLRANRALAHAAIRQSAKVCVAIVRDGGLAAPELTTALRVRAPERYRKAPLGRAVQRIFSEQQHVVDPAFVRTLHQIPGTNGYGLVFVSSENGPPIRWRPDWIQPKSNTRI